MTTDGIIRRRAQLEMAVVMMDLCLEEGKAMAAYAKRSMRGETSQVSRFCRSQVSRAIDNPSVPLAQPVSFSLVCGIQISKDPTQRCQGATRPKPRHKSRHSTAQSTTGRSTRPLGLFPILRAETRRERVGDGEPCGGEARMIIMETACTAKPATNVHPSIHPQKTFDMPQKRKRLETHMCTSSHNLPFQLYRPLVIIPQTVGSSFPTPRLCLTLGLGFLVQKGLAEEICWSAVSTVNRLDPEMGRI